MGRKRPRVGGRVGVQLVGGCGSTSGRFADEARLTQGQGLGMVRVRAGAGEVAGQHRKKVGRWVCGRAGGPSHPSSQGGQSDGAGAGTHSRSLLQGRQPTPCLAESLSCFLVP